jgi:hypothetical protein
MPDARASGGKFYPRGFVGGSLPIRLAVKPKPYEIKIRSKVQVGLIVPLQTTVEPNASIEILYAQYIKRSADTKSFEFREAALITALHAFGLPNFYNWYMSQLAADTVGDMHVRFLADTLKFLHTGRREMTLETWAQLVKPDSEAIRPITPCAMAKEYFRMENREYPLNPALFSMADTIQQWCAQPQGFEDLLGTLHVLFGNI